jgi:hypothetical protein
VFRQDYLMRLIEQLGQAIRRIAGLNDAENYGDALDEIERRWNDLLGVPHELIAVVDTPTLAGMLGAPEKMRAAVRLLVEEARALAGKGDPVHATLRYRLAIELLLEARAIAEEPDDEAVLLELSRHVPVNQLDARYR